MMTPILSRLPLRAWAETCLDLLYPPHCAFCRSATRSGREVICRTCLKSARRILPPACEICSAPSFGAVTRVTHEGEADAHRWDDWDGDSDDSDGADEPLPLPPASRSTSSICPSCRISRPLYDSAHVPFRSRAVVRETIHRFKYDGQLHFLPILGEWLALVGNDWRLKTAFPYAIVPVPLHPTRHRERGFNQAALLAGELSKHLGLPVLNALRRTHYTASQTRFARGKRMENLRNAFEIRQSVDVRNLNLLLVDDVLTTGSTVNACAFPLKKAGAAVVRVATVARG